MTEVVGNTSKKLHSGASFLETYIDHDYRLLNELKIRDLPFEVLYLILSNVVLLQMCCGDKTKRPADGCIFMSLASVNGLWSEIIKRRHFKTKILRFLTVYFRKAKKRSTIIDHNYEFLKEVLQPHSLIDQLELTGCLKQNQTSSLKRIKRVRDKNVELLFLLRNFNSKFYSLFVQSLCSTDQNNAARVLEHGGETVKVHVANQDTFQTAELGISLATKLLEEPQQYDKELRLTGLKDEQRLKGVSVLHANQELGITIWLWFRTADAWNKMKAKSQEALLEIIQKLFQRLIPKSTIESQNVQLQYINLNTEFAERKLLAQPKRRFRIKGVAEHVVVLNDEIYVTQRRSIHVYKNKVPYPQSPDIRLPDAILVFNNEIPNSEVCETGLSTDFPGKYNPLQIAVCQMHSCLYAADRKTRCIYKIEPMFDHRITSWLKEERSLFVATTFSGDVLVLRRETEANCLGVFNNDGVLKHDISLRDDFYRGVEMVREIAPNVLALIYSLHRGRPPSYISAIFTMHLNRSGSIDHKHTWGRTINCLVPFSSCQLLIGVGHDYDDEKRYRIGLYDCHFWSIQIQNIFNEKTIPVDIYYSADQKELFVLTAYKPIHLPEGRNQFIDIIEKIDDMRKQSKWFPTDEERAWFWSGHNHLTEMKRKHLAYIEENFKIEICKMNYEDENFD